MQDISDNGSPISSIGLYRLLRLLGQGMTTQVYLGEHQELHTQVAVKLQQGYWVESDVQRFLARAEVMTNLQHHHIVQVYDFGVENHTAYMAMEYAPYGTLRQRHPKGARVPLALVVMYVQQLAEALHYVHQHNLIHRDIKPHNMLLGTNERILLNDFGIAVVSQSMVPDQSAFYDFEGTALYAAPEQLVGMPRRSSDQYALGVVVYEWLCGTWPFNGNFEEVVQQHFFEMVPSLREKDNSIPVEVERVVLKALAKDPDSRYPSMLDFATALTAASQQASQASQASAHLNAFTKTTQPQHTLLSSPTPKRQFKSPLPFAKA